MKQKIVIKVQAHCDKCRKSAMKIAATADGVISVTIQGNDKDQIVVIGTEVDSAGLCTALRKKLKGASLVSVEEVKDPKPDDKKKGDENEGKKKENGGQQEKKNGNKEGNKSEKATITVVPAPAGLYHCPCPCPCPPPQQYCYPNQPQYCLYPVPPNDNQGCVTM